MTAKKRARKQAKPARTPQKVGEIGPPTPPTLPPKEISERQAAFARAAAAATKARYINLQIGFLEKASNPVGPKAGFKFDPKTKDQLRKLTVRFMQKQLDREITNTDYQAMIQGVNALERILESTEIEDRLNELEQLAYATTKVIERVENVAGPEREGGEAPQLTAPRPRKMGEGPQSP